MGEDKSVNPSIEGGKILEITKGEMTGVEPATLDQAPAVVLRVGESP